MSGTEPNLAEKPRGGEQNTGATDLVGTSSDRTDLAIAETDLAFFFALDAEAAEPTKRATLEETRNDDDDS